MHKWANISTVKCYLLFVRHLNSLNYVSLRIQSHLDPIYSLLGGTSLTVTTLKVKCQRSNVLKYPSDYLLQPPGKPIHYG